MKRPCSATLLVLWAIATATATGCGSAPADTAAATSPPPASAPQRILSAAPNITEICCALGLRDRLVGRTRFCTYPPGIESVPSFGGLVDASSERIASLKPDLVLVAGNGRTVSDRLATLQLRVERLPDVTLEDIFLSIRRIGVLCDRSGRADELVTRIEAELGAVDRRFADSTPARVLMLVTPLSDPPSPPVVAAPGSFYDDLLRRAGHTNIVPDNRKPFPQLSLEFIVRQDPDVIIELDPTGELRPDGASDALRAWRNVPGPVRAVDEGRVYVLGDDKYCIPGPRIAQTYEAIAGAISSRP